MELAERNAQIQIIMLPPDQLSVPDKEDLRHRILFVHRKLPSIDRIEAYDISNISGFESVGSMVVYERGKPKRSDYRKFKLRTVSGPDDYASMHEVLTRRFTHGMQEQKELEEKNMPQSMANRCASS